MSKGVSRVSTKQDVVAEEWAPLTHFPSIIISFLSFSLVFIFLQFLQLLSLLFLFRFCLASDLFFVKNGNLKILREHFSKCCSHGTRGKMC